MCQFRWIIHWPYFIFLCNVHASYGRIPTDGGETNFYLLVLYWKFFPFFPFSFSLENVWNFYCVLVRDARRCGAIRWKWKVCNFMGFTGDSSGQERRVIVTLTVSDAWCVAHGWHSRWQKSPLWQSMWHKSCHTQECHTWHAQHYPLDSKRMKVEHRCYNTTGPLSDFKAHH